MIRAAVVHDSLNNIGGAEKLCIETIKVLKKLGYHIDLMDLEKSQKQFVEKYYDFNINMYIEKEIVVNLFKTLPSTIYTRYLNWLFRDLIIFPFFKNKYNLSITTFPLLPIVFSNVVYLHFPDYLPAVLYTYKPEYLKNTFMRAYSELNTFLAKCTTKFFNFLSYKPIIVTNSRFSKSIIKNYLDSKVFIIYPPVDVEKLLVSRKISHRTETVLTMSRFGIEKKLETILKIAELVKNNVNFVILGAVNNNEAKEYLNYLQEKTKSLGIEDKVTFVINASIDDKLNWLSTAKILLHPMEFEHFGISIVEGMAAGLIPLVHRSGGPWMDIVDFGKYGFGFRTSQQAAGIIKKLLANNDVYDKYSEIAAKRARNFSTKRFAINLSNLLRKISYSCG